MWEIPHVFEKLKNPTHIYPTHANPRVVRNPTSHPTSPTWIKVYSRWIISSIKTAYGAVVNFAILILLRRNYLWFRRAAADFALLWLSKLVSTGMLREFTAGVEILAAAVRRSLICFAMETAVHDSSHLRHQFIIVAVSPTWSLTHKAVVE